MHGSYVLELTETQLWLVSSRIYPALCLGQRRSGVESKELCMHNGAHPGLRLSPATWLGYVGPGLILAVVRGLCGSAFNMAASKNIASTGMSLGGTPSLLPARGSDCH